MLRLISLAAALGALLWVGPATAATGFTTEVSPPDQTNATEPSVAVDRSDGTVWVAWQAGGTHVARSDDGGRTWAHVLTENDIGDVDIRVGGSTNCTTDALLVPTIGCASGAHRVYVSSLEQTPLALQT